MSKETPRIANGGATESLTPDQIQALWSSSIARVSGKHPEAKDGEKQTDADQVSWKASPKRMGLG